MGAEAMTPDHMMEDITGAPSYGLWFKDQTAKTKDIIENCQKNSLIVLTSSPDKKIQGIANSHAYSLLGVIENQGSYIYKIRNPWGRF
jgi:hypothetical protein